MTDKKVVPISGGPLRVGKPPPDDPLAPVWPITVLAGRVMELCEWVYQIPHCSPGNTDLAKLPHADAPQIAELDRIVTEKVTPEQARALAVILLDSRGRAAGDAAPVMVGAMVRVVTANGRRRPVISAEVMAAAVERLWFKTKPTPFNGDVGELRAACDTVREHIVGARDHAREAAEYRQRLAEGKRPKYEVMYRFQPIEDRDDEDDEE